MCIRQQNEFCVVKFPLSFSNAFVISSRLFVDVVVVYVSMSHERIFRIT